MSTPMERAAAAKTAGPSSSSPKIAPPAGSSSGKRPADGAPGAPAGKKPMFKEETSLASEGHVSTREADEKAMRYVKILQQGANGVKGILATYDPDGEELIPYMHQRQAVKFCAAAGGPNGDARLLAHDAGTGKTATFFQLMAAIELLVGGGACAVVTVPPATLSQWEETAHTWLNLRGKDNLILVTNKEKLITAALLKRVRVLVISRHLLARLYKVNWEYVPKAEQNERGQWVSKWIRKPLVPLHPIWEKKWDLMGVDEAHFSARPPRAHPEPTLTDSVPTFADSVSRLLTCSAEPRHRVVRLAPPARQGRQPRQRGLVRRLQEARRAHRHPRVQQAPGHGRPVQGHQLGARVPGQALLVARPPVQDHQPRDRQAVAEAHRPRQG